MIRAFSFLQRHPQSGILYFRKTIPRRHRYAFGGRHEYKRSLGTSEKKIAAPQAMVLYARLQAKINQLDGVTGMSDDGFIGKIEIDSFEFADGRKATSVKIDEGSPEANAKAFNATFGGPGAPQALPPAQVAQPSGIESEKLATVMEKFCEHQMMDGNWTSKTRSEYESVFSLMLEYFRNVEVATITKSQVRTFCEKLRYYPTNARKRFPGKTFRQLVASKHDRPISIQTFNGNYIQRYSALFSWAVDMDYCAVNVFATAKRKVGTNNAERAMDKKPPFNSEELRKIFSPSTFNRNILKEWQIWVPLIALYSGARQQEIAQLRTEDIIEENGIYGMRFTFYKDANEANGRVKNASSRRTVPIHPSLVSFGLIKHVDSMRDKGEAKLFPELFTTLKTKAGDKVSRWFNRTYMRKCGLLPKDPGRNISFHSFRHNYTDCMKRGNVPEIKSAQLTGHTVSSIAYGTYGSDLPLKDMHDLVADVVHYDLE